jgi:hypothetical protein
MATWEYMVVVLNYPYPNYEDQQRQLNELGRQGWELVIVVKHMGYFKRQKS